MRPIATLALFLAAAAAAPADPNRLYPTSRLTTLERISVETIGAGPDVVLIPGLGSSRATWRATADRLQTTHRLHLIQVAGFAGEPARANAAPGPLIKPVADQIETYIEQAHLTRPAVIGHSLGGVIAMRLALDHPEDVGKLMIVDTLAFYTELFAGVKATAGGAQPYADTMGKQMLGQSDADFAKGAAQAAAGMATNPADQTRIQSWAVASARPVFVRAMQEDMTTDLRPEVAHLAMPVTVYYEASLAPLITADYAPVPHATLVAAAPGARHFVMYDDPQGFNAALDRFLR